jgi:hypothetical protein
LPTLTPTPPSTLTPTPSPTETPTPLPTETPTPPPASNVTFYLHNDPSPPVGDTTSQSALPMDFELPTAPVLYNYDTNRDASPGLLIAKGGSGVYEINPSKYQAWRTPAFAEAMFISGEASLKLWGGMKDFNNEESGTVTVYLRDFDGLSYVELGSGTLTDAPWHGGSPWVVLKTITFPVEPYPVAAGHKLELKVIVEGSSDDDMWFAYDTDSEKSRITVGASPQAPRAGSALSRLLAGWPPASWARWLFT